MLNGDEFTSEIANGHFSASQISTFHRVIINGKSDCTNLSPFLGISKVSATDRKTLVTAM